MAGGLILPIDYGFRRIHYHLLKKAMCGQGINYTEQKVKVTLSVTPQTKQGLLYLAEEAHDSSMGVSMADIVERWVTSYAELIDLFDAMDGINRS